MRKTKNGQQHPNIQIAVENFGPIEKAKIDFRPLTVFVGESNTGKTYLSTLIYALYQNFEGLSRFPWSHRVSSYLRGTYRSQNRTLGIQEQVDLQVETIEMLETLNIHGRSFKFSDLPDRMRSWLESNFKKSTAFENELQRCFDLDSVSELIRFIGSKGNELKVSLKVSEKNQPLWNFEMKGSESGISVGGDINEDMIFCTKDEEISQEILDLEDLTGFLHINKNETEDCFYLPAARSGIMETHAVITSSLIDRATRGRSSEEGATLMGTTGDFLKHIINYDERRSSSDEMSGIAKVLEDEVLRGEIEVRRPAAGYPEFRYRPQSGEQVLRMSRSSSMVLELVPLVLFLRGVVGPGDTLIIEEPEAHLHPAAQTKVALTLARLVQAGVRVIITTHSDWLLEQIGNLIREGEVMKLGKNKTEPTTWLTKEEVGAWWFRTDEPVQEITFEHIAGIEPEEYGEVAEELYNHSVDLRTQLEEAEGGTEVEQE